MLFPRTKFTIENSLKSQILHINTEELEVLTEMLSHDKVDHFKLAIEIHDLIHSCETALHILHDRYGVSLERAYSAVLQKNTERGYYL